MSNKRWGIFRLSQVTPEEFRQYFKDVIGYTMIETSPETTVYNSLSDLSEVYPNFREWYQKVQREMEQTHGAMRDVLFALPPVPNNENLCIAAVAIVKNTATEKKICTFRIMEQFRGCELTSELFEACFSYLGTRTPLFTVPQKYINVFQPYTEKYEFILTEKKDGYYMSNSTEYFYNAQ